MAQGCGSCEIGSGPGKILLESASTKMAKMSLRGEEETGSGSSLTRSPQQGTEENVVKGPLAARCWLESTVALTQDHSTGTEPRQTVLTGC